MSFISRNIKLISRALLILIGFGTIADARIPFGMFPFKPVILTMAPILDATGGGGVSTGFSEVLLITNTGNAMTGALNVTVSNGTMAISSVHRGIGDTCTATFLMAGAYCQVEIATFSGGGSATVTVDDGIVFSTPVNFYDCPGC